MYIRVPSLTLVCVVGLRTSALPDPLLALRERKSCLAAGRRAADKGIAAGGGGVCGAISMVGMEAVSSRAPAESEFRELLLLSTR